MDEVRTGALGGAVGMGVVTRRVLAAPVVCAAAAEGRVAVREVAGAAVSLGVATCVLDPVGVLNARVCCGTWIRQDVFD